MFILEQMSRAQYWALEQGDRPRVVALQVLSVFRTQHSIESCLSGLKSRAVAHQHKQILSPGEGKDIVKTDYT